MVVQWGGRLLPGPPRIRPQARVAGVFPAAKWESKSHLESLTAHSRYSISAVAMVMAMGCYDILLEVMKE